jgi:hypothetical protein
VGESVEPEVGRDKDATGGTVILFKPSGEAFHKLVTIRVTVNSEKRLVALESLLARSFINDRTQRVYANDLAKSTVLQGLPAVDRQSMQTLNKRN